MQGTIVRVDVRPGDAARAGQQLLVIESMKMEHVITADWSGVVQRVPVALGDTVHPGDALVVIEEAEVPSAEEMRRRAAEMFRVPEVSLDEVAERARQYLIQALSVRLLGEIEPLPA